MVSQQLIESTLQSLSIYYPGQNQQNSLSVICAMWKSAFNDDEVGDAEFGAAITAYLQGNEKLFADCNVNYFPKASQIRRAAVALKANAVYAEIERRQGQEQWKQMYRGFWRVGPAMTAEQKANWLIECERRYSAGKAEIEKEFEKLGLQTTAQELTRERG